jgi:hypothetical protein
MSKQKPDRFFVPEADKEPGYRYRWCNTDERNMLGRLAEGYEVVKFKEPELPKELRAEGAEVVPTSGVTRKRGTDLVLCRIREDAFQENIESRRRENRERHAGAIDTMVARAKENAERALAAAGLPAASGPLVFKDSPGAFKQ